VTRRQRTEILVEGDPALRSELAATIRDRYHTVVVDPPRRGLVMLRVRETAKRSLFLMGELLVTEARAEVEGHVGVGILAGDRPIDALDLAVVDGAFRAGVSEVAAWDSLLDAEAVRLGEVRRRDEAALLATRVRFETMEGA